MTMTKQATILPTVHPSRNELIYIAGFFDGEGCIHIYKSRSRGFTLQVSAANTDRQVIQFICDRFGGRIHRLQKKGNRKPCWRVDLVARRANHLLTALLPYLRVKKDQAELALEFQKSMSKYERPLTNDTISYRESLRIRLKELKEKDEQ